MPVNYLADLTAPTRTLRANLHLGIALAFVAGALNAGGFLAIGQYTSHMTGVLSAAADDAVLGNTAHAMAGVMSLLAFVAGAVTTALMVNYARRSASNVTYTAPLLVEAALLLVFGLVGASLKRHEFISVSLTAILLCYVMGLQNALITKISSAEIRTTHITGLVTDLGIEFGRLIYWNRTGGNVAPVVRANRTKLRVHGELVLAFAVGALLGALGFKHVGYVTTVPLALLLVLVSAAPFFRRVPDPRH
ncbi:MAG: DUF1275 domain-containing protein [Burkholderiales bacterium]|nr:DUF1275 domain-containing protein [Burkholderiales bacterium]